MRVDCNLRIPIQLLKDEVKGGMYIFQGTVRHERHQFVAQAAAPPAEAEGFSGGFRGLYSELGQVRDLVSATSCDLIRVFPVQ